ncbi:nicotinate-nucleotide adenylyltransferase [Candidatus Poriferisocius sp.]|uniref:nicotinate-nucleotide adenylyltransferase n=1 Tax=Candidatus Poriferisocius sp. TaxID=3101276 RepID=UPI003B0282B6
MSRVGIFGGTFDPVHVGHLVVAVWVRAELGLDKVLLVVANEPWQKLHRCELSPARDRLAMVQAAVGGIDGVEASAMEIDRGGLSYTVDTLAAVRAGDPDGSRFLILGSDAAAGLETWHRYPEIVRMAEVVVVDRPGAVGQRPPVAHRVVDCPLLDLSSTRVREWAEAGRPLDGLVPAAALAHCREKGLYGQARHR